MSYLITYVKKIMWNSGRPGENVFAHLTLKQEMS